MTLIDANYKTAKYEISLFFLCVKTNVSYLPIYTFVTYTESRLGNDGQGIIIVCVCMHACMCV